MCSRQAKTGLNWVKIRDLPLSRASSGGGGWVGGGGGSRRGDFRSWALESLSRQPDGPVTFLSLFLSPSLSFAAVCPHPSFVEVSDTCYWVLYTDFIDLHFRNAWASCFLPKGNGASAVLVTITSQQQQNDIEKIISSSSAQNAKKVWTALKVKKKTFANGTMAWLDVDNRPLTLTIKIRLALPVWCCLRSITTSGSLSTVGLNQVWQLYAPLKKVGDGDALWLVTHLVVFVFFKPN